MANGAALFVILAFLYGALLFSGMARIARERMWQPDTSHAAPSMEYSNGNIDALPLGIIAPDVPRTMYLGHTYPIVLILSPSWSVKGSGIEARRTTGLQAMKPDLVKYSPNMHAQVTGPNFDITLTTPAMQATSLLEKTQWRWNVTPRRAGLIDLHLILDTNLDYGGSTVERTFQVCAVPLQK